MASSPRTGEPVAKRRRRWPFIIAGVFALLMLAVAGGFLYLRSAAGGALVKTKVLEAVNAALQGKLELGEVRLLGSFLTLTDAKLFTPEGELVAHLERVQARVEVWALTRGEVRIHGLKVEGPHLYLHSDERGLNLSRAIASRTPSEPEKPNPEGGALRFAVLDLKLVKGTFELQTGQQPKRWLDFTELAAEGGVRGSTFPLQLDGGLKLTGQARAPLQAPLTIEVTMKSSSQSATQAQVALSFGDSTLHARVGLPALQVDLDKLEVSQALREAFQLSVGNDGPWRVNGSLSLRQARLKAEAFGANASLEASYVLEPLKVNDFKLSVERLSPARFSPELSPSTVSLTVTGALTEADALKVSGRAEAAVHWQGPDGAEWADVDFRVSLEAGAVKIPQLAARLFGSKLEASGHGDVRTLGVKGYWTVPKAAAVTRGLSRAIGIEPIDAAGNGRLDFAVEGTWKAPSLSAQGRFEALAFPGVKLTGLAVDARVPNLMKPFEAGGDLKVTRLDVGTQHLDSLSASVSTWGRKLEATLTARGLNQLALKLTGTLGKDARSLEVAQMTFAYPEAQWALLAPAKMQWAEGHFFSELLTLAADKQRISWSGGWTPSALRGQLKIEAFNLARLPALLGAGGLKLQGELWVVANAGGTMKAPRVEAQVDLKNGAVSGVHGITLFSQVKYLDNRLQGSMKARSDLAALEGTWALPVPLSRQGPAQPLSLELKLDGLQVKKLTELSKAKVAAQGEVGGRLVLSGDTRAAQARLELNSAALEVTPSPRAVPVKIGAMKLTAGIDEQVKGDAQLDAQLFDGAVTLTVHSDGLQRSVREAMPSASEWKLLPLELGWNIAGLDATKVLEASMQTSGRFSSRGKVVGTLEAPTIDGTFGWKGIRAGAWQPHDFVATLHAGAGQSQLKAKLTRLEKVVASVDASLGVGPERWAQPAELDAATLKVEAQAGPLSLPQLLEMKSAGTQRWLTQGLVRLGLSAKGTLAAPKLTVHASVAEPAAAKVSLGKWDLTWDYGEKTHAVSAVIASPLGGTLKMKANTELDIGLVALRQGLAWKQAPFEASLDAREFDLGFLTGAHEKLRKLSGKIAGHAFANGTLSEPTGQGDLAIQDGMVSFMGLGEYKEIAAKLHADPKRFTVDISRIASAGGALALLAEAARVKEGQWTAKASGELKQFPIVSGDQTAAAISGRLSVPSGEYVQGWLDLREVSLAGARIDLPATQRKDLQDLDPREDILIVRKGETLAQVRQARAEQKAGGAPFKLRLSVAAPDGIQIRSADMRVDVELSEGFRVVYQDTPQVFGSITVTKGLVEVLGRRFIVSRESRIGFAGNATRPSLNVAAEWVNEREGVTVYVTVTGSGIDDIKLKTRSTPPLSESEIYTLLATGRTTLKRGAGASMSGEQAVSTVMGVAAAKLNEVLVSKLPIKIDVVTVEAGDKGLSDLRVELGKYIGDNLYIGYQGQTGADPRRGQNRHTGRLEYQLSKRITLEAFGGSELSAGAEFVWSYDY